MNRNDFRQLADDHLRHAKALLDAELYSGAYYICGIRGRVRIEGLHLQSKRISSISMRTRKLPAEPGPTNLPISSMYRGSRKSSRRRV
jgi:hypothetical protein